jgi:hypothetical protein
MFSSWNWANGQYDYYQAPRWNRLGYGDELKAPTSNALSGGLGEDPDHSGHRLPVGAKYVGSGPQALGTIVTVSEQEEGIKPWLRLAGVLAAPAAIVYVLGWLGDRLKG